MILVFGGTTEGRKAVEVLEESGNTYFYSTKTDEQDITLHHGIRLCGAMNQEQMTAFCQENTIQLLVDAAHPFAQELHQTIVHVAESLQIPVIRYERIYPPRDSEIEWIDDYSQVPTDIHTLLATTGVQSISHLKWLEKHGIKVIYRILNRESSIQLAHEQGATDDQLCFYPQTAAAEAVLMKESGESGGFSEKIKEAKEKGMRIIVLKRPQLSIIHCRLSIVNGPYGLRRMVEKLLPDFYPLHSGLTTGTCATAAAVAATIRLFKNETPDEVPVLLPDGETIYVSVGYGDDYAYCIKEAGDDPDVTNGIEVRASVKQIANGKQPTANIEILGGEGVGRFTLPGFDYPPGEPAINKAPREMIRQNLMVVANSTKATGRRESGNPYILHSSLTITLSVPNGADIAHRTFNPRLGIEGGISIIGVSGIVKPFSEEAFINSIRKCMQVAKASDSDRVVINSGGKSERFVKAHYPTLPQQAFVEYGNYIGETLKIADELQFENVTLGVMLGKAVKLANGHLDTHSRKATMDKDFIQQMLDESNCQLSIINCPLDPVALHRQVKELSLARELWDKLPKDKIEVFAQTVIRHCMQHCQPLVPHAHLTLLLIDDDGTIHSL